MFLLQIHHQVAGEHDSVVDRGCSMKEREPTCQQPGLGNVFPPGVVTVSGRAYGTALWYPQHLNHESGGSVLLLVRSVMS